MAAARKGRKPKAKGSLRGARRAPRRGARGGRQGKVIPAGSRFMRTVTTAKITAMRDAEAEGGEARRVYDACLMRRSGRKGLRKIALAAAGGGRTAKERKGRAKEMQRRQLSRQRRASDRGDAV